MRFSLKSIFIAITLIAFFCWQIGTPKIYHFDDGGYYAFSPQILPNFTYKTHGELVIFFPGNEDEWGSFCTINKNGVYWLKGYSNLH